MSAATQKSLPKIKKFVVEHGDEVENVCINLEHSSKDTSLTSVWTVPVGASLARLSGTARDGIVTSLQLHASDGSSSPVFGSSETSGDTPFDSFTGAPALGIEGGLGVFFVNAVGGSQPQEQVPAQPVVQKVEQKQMKTPMRIPPSADDAKEQLVSFPCMQAVRTALPVVIGKDKFAATSDGKADTPVSTTNPSTGDREGPTTLGADTAGKEAKTQHSRVSSTTSESAPAPKFPWMANNPRKSSSPVGIIGGAHAQTASHAAPTAPITSEMNRVNNSAEDGPGRQAASIVPASVQSATSKSRARKESGRPSVAQRATQLSSQAPSRALSTSPLFLGINSSGGYGGDLQTIRTASHASKNVSPAVAKCAWMKDHGHAVEKHPVRTEGSGSPASQSIYSQAKFPWMKASENPTVSSSERPSEASQQAAVSPPKFPWLRDSARSSAAQMENTDLVTPKKIPAGVTAKAPKFPWMKEVTKTSNAHQEGKNVNMAASRPSDGAGTAKGKNKEGDPSALAGGAAKAPKFPWMKPVAQSYGSRPTNKSTATTAASPPDGPTIESKTATDPSSDAEGGPPPAPKYPWMKKVVQSASPRTDTKRTGPAAADASNDAPITSRNDTGFSSPALAGGAATTTKFPWMKEAEKSSNLGGTVKSANDNTPRAEECISPAQGKSSGCSPSTPSGDAAKAPKFPWMKPVAQSYGSRPTNKSTGTTAASPKDGPPISSNTIGTSASSKKEGVYATEPKFPWMKQIFKSSRLPAEVGSTGTTAAAFSQGDSSTPINPAGDAALKPAGRSATKPNLPWMNDVAQSSRHSTDTKSTGLATVDASRDAYCTARKGTGSSSLALGSDEPLARAGDDGTVPKFPWMKEVVRSSYPRPGRNSASTTAGGTSDGASNTTRNTTAASPSKQPDGSSLARTFPWMKAVVKNSSPCADNKSTCSTAAHPLRNAPTRANEPVSGTPSEPAAVSSTTTKFPWMKEAVQSSRPLADRKTAGKTSSEAMHSTPSTASNAAGTVSSSQVSDNVSAAAQKFPWMHKLPPQSSRGTKATSRKRDAPGNASTGPNNPSKKKTSQGVLSLAGKSRADVKASVVDQGGAATKKRTNVPVGSDEDRQNSKVSFSQLSSGGITAQPNFPWMSGIPGNVPASLKGTASNATGPGKSGEKYPWMADLSKSQLSMSFNPATTRPAAGVTNNSEKVGQSTPKFSWMTARTPNGPSDGSTTTKPKTSANVESVSVMSNIGKAAEQRKMKMNVPSMSADEKKCGLQSIDIYRKTQGLQTGANQKAAQFPWMKV